MSEAVKKIKPLNPRIAFSHDYAESDYPDTIRIPMEDGHIITYCRQIDQPHPAVQKSIDLIRIMQDCTYGGYKPKHEKK